MNDNWLQHKNVDIYLDSLESNPYISELRHDYDSLKQSRLVRYFDTPHTNWLTETIRTNHITKTQISEINHLFDSDVLLKIFTDYLTTLCKSKASISAFFSNKIALLNSIYTKLKLTAPVIPFAPTPLKFVTTTAIAWIVDPAHNINIDFKKIYTVAEISDDIMLIHSAAIYKPQYLGQIVGCKTGGEITKGFFKKKNLGDFYNCTTVNIMISQIKSVNIKIFNNGKLQMTGISKPSDGERAVKYLCKAINNMQSHKIITNNDAYIVAPFSYKTVMINTCYELGICINREALYTILTKRYKLNTIYDADGYPGVRVEYYYNTLTTNTEFEGLCKCTERCRGKGVGEGDKNCRKISIAIFQSGSTIIAGGCNSVEPIYITYNFINNVIKTIIGEVKKRQTKANKLKKERATTIFLKIETIINNEYMLPLLEFRD
tara:strand:- start:2583 stop:3881 length:1299 start_codon:yes stop_codon:yes gene_type:complete